MAKIFVSLYNFCKVPEDYCAMPPFFDSFIDGLRSAGNEVKCYQTKVTVNRGYENPVPEAYKNMLREFDPDLCILFNNSFWDISRVVDCPIIVYDVDSPLEWQLQDNLKEHPDRYLYVYNQTNTLELLTEEFGAPRERCCYIPFYSEIQADTEASFDKNIVFLGTNWSWYGYRFLNDFLKKDPSREDIKKALEVMERYVKDPLKPSHELYYELGNMPHDRLSFGDLRRCALEVSGYRRIQTLSAVADLGLEVYGNYWNINCMNYYPDVLSCVRQDKIWTKKDSQAFYNSSKIALNTKHIHAVNGFSFRVCDILASNACLASEYSKDLETLFPKVDIPFFTSPAEAREQCLRLLNNENLRQDIVMAAHEAIDENFRFRNVLEALEGFTGLCLRSDRPGTLEIFPATAQEAEEEARGVYGQEPSREGLSPFKQKYYDTVGKHIGYDPYHYFPTRYICLGKLKLFKVMKVRNDRKELYMGCIPLASCNWEPEGSRVRLLLPEKLGHGFKKLRMPRGLKKLGWYPAKKSRLRRIKRKWKQGKPIRVCLFVSRINCWMFEDVYRLLKESGRYEPVIVIKPFLSRGEEHMKECMSATYEALVKRGYDPIKGYDEETDTYLDVRRQIDPDVVFYTKYWKPHFHPNFYIDSFRDRMTLLIDYGYNVVAHYSAMNFELQNDVDIYFYQSPIHKKIAREHMDNKARNVAIVGAPKLDTFLDPAYVPEDVWKPQKTPKKRIIWAPHHEDRTASHMYQLDAFYDICDVMLEAAEHYKDQIQIAFKPHPLLKVKLLDKWGEEATARYYEKWDALENGQLADGEFVDMFLTSDAMILDSLSFIAEYSILGKPALFTVGSKARVLLNEVGQAIYEHMYEAKGDLKKGIYDFIDSVLAGEDPKAEERKRFIQQKMLPPNGKTAAGNICDYMDEFIKHKGKIKL